MAQQHTEGHITAIKCQWHEDLKKENLSQR